MLTCRHWCWRRNGSRGGTIYQRLISVTREVLLGEARDSIPSWTDMWGLGHWESSLTPSSTCSASHGLPGAGSRGTRDSAHSPHVTETVLVDSCSETLSRGILCWAEDVSKVVTSGYFTLEKDMATHSSILAWETPRTEEPGRLQLMGSQRQGLQFTGLDMTSNWTTGTILSYVFSWWLSG